MPPPDTRWLDLIRDGTHRLIRLDLRAAAPQAGQAGGAVERRRPVSAVERLLAVEAEAILAGAGDRRGPAADPDLGEIAGALSEAGLIAADSQVPGQVAALCQRLGVPGPGIAAAELPERWASVLARLPLADTAGDPADPEVFAPLAVILPEIEGARFALAGLSVAAGESYLHVAATGLPEQAGRFAPGWRPGFSWWVRDDGGNWHVAVIAEPDAHPPGEAEFRLRLIPPLAVPLDVVEVLAEAGSARVRVVVPVRGAPEMPDT